jgi:hypothetical protein
MHRNPFCFISEYRRRNDGSFLAYERRDDSVFGVTEEMAIERLGDRAVVVLPTRFVECNEYVNRKWLLSSVISFCHQKGGKKLLNIVGCAGYVVCLCMLCVCVVVCCCVLCVVVCCCVLLCVVCCCVLLCDVYCMMLGVL